MTNACTVAPYHRQTVFGDTFDAGHRTACHLDWTFQRVARLRKRIPGVRLLILQGCYHRGFLPSAGTHDKDEVVDMVLVNSSGQPISGATQQRWFRRLGWFGWVRTPAQGFTFHFHGISGRRRDCDIGVFVPGQIIDYYNHAFGLEGMHEPGSDHSWFPPDINATIFDYRTYLEDNMAYKDWPQADRDALVADVRNGLAKEIVLTLMQWDVKADPDVELTTREALVKASNATDLIRAQQRTS